MQVEQWRCAGRYGCECESGRWRDRQEAVRYLLLLHGLRLSFEFLYDRSERLRIDSALTQRDAQTELIARQTRLQQLAHREQH